ncbi:MAG: radical SAM protein, partial [Candidatus Cloacimonetes bacterium]|nr:radical SAM protein [Candidatus Cloacimonadota bacterium]
MANIAITSVCNRNCCYCFTGDKSSDNAKLSQFIPSDVFEKAVNILAASNQNQIRLIGGEPTLHPQIRE